MSQNIDERYASDPVWHQTREAAYISAQRASRLLAADIPPGEVSPGRVATALLNNFDYLAAFVDAHRAMLALESSQKEPK